MLPVPLLFLLRIVMFHNFLLIFLLQTSFSYTSQGSRCENKIQAQLLYQMVYEKCHNKKMKKLVFSHCSLHSMDLHIIVFLLPWISGSYFSGLNNYLAHSYLNYIQWQNLVVSRMAWIIKLLTLSTKPAQIDNLRSSSMLKIRFLTMA